MSGFLLGLRHHTPSSPAQVGADGCCTLYAHVASLPLAPPAAPFLPVGRRLHSSGAKGPKLPLRASYYRPSPPAPTPAVALWPPCFLARCLGASVSPRPKAVRQEPPPRPSFPVDQLTELLFMPDSLLCPEGHESTKGEAKVGPTHPGVREGLWPPPAEPGPKPCAAASSGSLPQYRVRHTCCWARGDQQCREPRRREPALEGGNPGLSITASPSPELDPSALAGRAVLAEQ